MVSGIALVDKPRGISSHTVVAQARRALGTKKVGHAGTLDPAATGLLVLGVGPGTRLLTFVVGADKSYRATMRLGYGTTTDDAEGEALASAGGIEAVSEESLRVAAAALVGEIDQVPSTYSAIKVDGKRAYDLARSGQDVALTSRRVTIHALDVDEVTRGEGVVDVTMRVECSSGTYIRAIARDIGSALGVGGHLTELRRDVVGSFLVEDAVSAEDLTESHLLDLASVAQQILPSIELGEVDTEHVRHGRAVDTASWPVDTPVAALSASTGELVAVVQASAGKSRILMGVAG